jgi:transcriptional regulator with XRE-family HTH domain
MATRSRSEFGLAVAAARDALHITQRQLAARVGKKPTQVYRWEQLRVVPRLEDRMRLIQAMAEAPHDVLARLAAASDVTLESLGMAPPPPPPPPPSPPPATTTPPLVAAAPPAPAPKLEASVQTVVDDALREAGEEIDVSPRLLRPALSRMLDRIARAGVPIDAAARMVLGVPKKDAKDARSGATPGKA